MMRLTKHFSREEFLCKCHRDCGADVVDFELLEVLNYVRIWAGEPVHINSGNRCIEHNMEVGGSKNSQHLKGKAADIRIEGILPRVIYEMLDTMYPNKYGIGLYKDFVHIDVRNKKARW